MKTRKVSLSLGLIFGLVLSGCATSSLNDVPVLGGTLGTKEPRNITSEDQIVRPTRPISTRKKIAGTKPIATTQQGRDIKIDARNADSLEKSLYQITEPLSQAETVYFMTALHEVSLLEYCLHTGDAHVGAKHTGHLTVKECYGYLGRPYSTKNALAYASDRRMDNSVPYTRSSLMFGTSKFGHSRAQSYVYFIEAYAPYVDGKTRPEIEAFYESYFGE